jgi:hypothetical protein
VDRQRKAGCISQIIF